MFRDINKYPISMLHQAGMQLCLPVQDVVIDDEEIVDRIRALIDMRIPFSDELTYEYFEAFASSLDDEDFDLEAYADEHEIQQDYIKDIGNDVLHVIGQNFDVFVNETATASSIKGQTIESLPLVCFAIEELLIRLLDAGVNSMGDFSDSSKLEDIECLTEYDAEVILSLFRHEPESVIDEVRKNCDALVRRGLTE